MNLRPSGYEPDELPTAPPRDINMFQSGDYLLSRGASPRVPSAFSSLTVLFGMGRSVSSKLSPPDYIKLEKTEFSQNYTAIKIYDQALDLLVSVS